MSAEHAGTKATVMIIESSATLRLQSAGNPAQTISLGNDWKRVSNVRFSPNASRLAIVADAATPQVTVVDVSVARVLVTYPVTAAALSPDGRAIILEHVRDRQIDDNSRFSLVSLNAPGDPPQEHPAILKLLAARGSLARQSELQWTDPEVVAFIVAAGSEASVVAIQVDNAGRIEKQGMKPLVADDLVDASKLAGVSPVKAIAGAEITRIPSAGLTLRLSFPSNPALRLRNTDVRLWE